MNDSATNLDRLHDIVMPAPVPLWPPAPGWYFVMGGVVLVCALGGYRWWKRWQANAYRRQALRELADAETPAQIAQLLRRAALVIAPRDIVASQTGDDWPEWLAAHWSEPMPAGVQDQLSNGLYRTPTAVGDFNSLRTYAATWISRHQTSSLYAEAPDDRV